MIKLAYGDGKVFVTLTTTEFSGLAGKSHSSVSDGTNISLASIKEKVDLVDSKTAELALLKMNAQDMVNTITSIGI